MRVIRWVYLWCTRSIGEGMGEDGEKKKKKVRWKFIEILKLWCEGVESVN